MGDEDSSDTGLVFAPVSSPLFDQPFTRTEGRRFAFQLERPLLNSCAAASNSAYYYRRAKESEGVIAREAAATGSSGQYCSDHDGSLVIKGHLPEQVFDVTTYSKPF